MINDISKEERILVNLAMYLPFLKEQLTVDHELFKEVKVKLEEPYQAVIEKALNQLSHDFHMVKEKMKIMRMSLNLIEFDCEFYIFEVHIRGKKEEGVEIRYK